MSTLGELQKDHEAVRQALSGLEEALGTSQGWDLIQAEYLALARLLAGHIQREEETMAPYTRRIQVTLRQRTPSDDGEPQIILRELDALFSGRGFVPTGIRVLQLCRLIDELRGRLDEEEREIFPILFPVGRRHYEAGDRVRFGEVDATLA